MLSRRPRLTASKTLRMVAVAMLAVACGCSAAGGSGVESTELAGAPDDTDLSGEALTGTVSVGSTLKTTADVNFRKGASTSYGVIRVLSTGTQVTVVASSPKNGFYNVKHQGTTGWVYGNYLKVVSSDDSKSDSGGSTTTSSSRTAALSRAADGVGFSYWWGHGRWRPEGPTSSTKGSCSGSCPSCSHSGSYGADCSGFVAKVWQVPSSNNDVTDDSHPYSTVSFDSDTSAWKTISRSSLQGADAFVYNTNGSGHIMVYEKGDGWGSLWSYECKGCSAGCVRNLRTVSSSYHAIRHY